MKQAELIKKLRSCDGFRCRDCELKNEDVCNPILMEQAADAIEELSKALDAVNDAHNEGYDVGYWAGRRDYEPKWIPIAERLPDKNMWCLVICNEWGGRITRISTFLADYFGERFEEDGKVITRFVTHWMPLPSAEGLNET